MDMIIDERRESHVVFRVIIALATIIWSFVVLNKAFYMDEAGLLSIYKGIYQGQRMFVDAWGPLQMGGILTYPLFALYDYVLKPYLDLYGIGLVLYMRIIYQIIRLFVSIYLYSVLRRTQYKDNAFWASYMYYILFVSFKNFSYKSICDFAVILFIAWGIRYLSSQKKFYCILMGIATCVAVLAYPTMIILPFAFVIALVVMMKRGYNFVGLIFLYSVTCFAIGISFLVYLEQSSGIKNVLAQLQYMEDSDFDYPLYGRLGMMLLSYFVFAVIAYIPVVIIFFVRKKAFIDRYIEEILLSLYWIAFMLLVCFLRPASISTTRFVYAALLIFFWYPYLIYEEKDYKYTRIGMYRLPDFDNIDIGRFIFALSVVVQLIWAISTNQEITVPGHMCYYVVIAFMLLIDEGSGLRILQIGLIISALFFNCFWVAEGNGGYSDILEARRLVTNGAYMGIELNEQDYLMNEACYDLTTNYVDSDSNLLDVCGFETSAYLNSDATQAAGSAYTRTHKNTRLLEYWEMNPENKADYVLINTNSLRYEEFQKGECAKAIYSEYTKEVASENGIILLTK